MLETQRCCCNSCLQDGKAAKEPTLSKLTFADSGVYVCEASMTGLVRRRTFELIVEGQQLFNSPASLTDIDMNSLKPLWLSQDPGGKGAAAVCQASGLRDADTAWVPLELFLLKEDGHRGWNADGVSPFCCREACDHQPDQTPRRRRQLQSRDVRGRGSAGAQLPVEHQQHGGRPPTHGGLLLTCSTCAWQCLMDVCFWKVPLGLSARLNPDRLTEFRSKYRRLSVIAIERRPYLLRVFSPCRCTLTGCFLFHDDQHLFVSPRRLTGFIPPVKC